MENRNKIRKEGENEVKHYKNKKPRHLAMGGAGVRSQREGQ